MLTSLAELIQQVAEEMSMKTPLDELSVRFLRQVKADMGPEMCTRSMRVLRDVLGTDWAGRVVLDVLSDTYGGGNRFIIERIGDKKIEAIKEVRAFTGVGLKEAKDLVEAVGYGTPQVVEGYGEAGPEGKTTKEQAARALAFETAMRNCNCWVKPYYG
jgi:hypothetical protein